MNRIATIPLAWAILAAGAAAQDPSKKAVESAIKEAMGHEEENARPIDVSKRAVERPIKDAMALPEEAASSPSDMLVAWHPSVEGALEASKASGKPVLVFHLLGRLDETFC